MIHLQTIRSFFHHFGVKLATIFAALTSLTIVIFTLLNVEEQTRILTEELHNQAGAVAQNLATITAQHVATRDHTAIETTLLRAARFPSIRRIQVIDAEGRLLGSVARLDGTPTPLYTDEVPTPPASITPVTQAFKEETVIWYPVTVPELVGWVRVVQSNALIEQAEREIWFKNIRNGAVGLILLFLLVIAILRRPSLSLSRYTEFADRLNERYGAQLEVDESSIEFRRLGNALNRASRRIHHQDLAIQKILADLERVAALVEHSPNVVFSLDENLDVVYANHSAMELVGRFDLEVHALRELLPKGLVDTALFEGRRSLANAKFETHYRGHAFLWTFSLLREQRILNCYATDITERKRAEDALRSSESHYRTLFNSTSDAIFLVEDGQVIDCNSVAPRLFGRPREALVGQSCDTLCRAIRKEGEATMSQRIAEVLRDGPQSFEMVIEREDGSFVAEASLTRVDLEGRAVTLVLIRDISARKSAEEALIKQANFDPLTNLPNRTLVIDRLSHAMKVAHRERHQVAVLFVDLDRFKHINDSFGHSAGDHLLLEVANRLRLAVRESDTVGRLGGDEFLIILEVIEDPIEAEIISERILRTLARPFLISNMEFYIGASIGISIYPADSLTPHELMRNADSAMYQSKESGRNRFTFYTRELNDKAKRRVKMESHLQHAMDRGELYLEYQPKIDAASGRIKGVEALLRWHNPELGQVPPSLFVPLAEDSGLIVAIGDWVLESACRDLMRWRRHHDHEIQIAINVSTRQFHANTLLDTLGRTLEEHRVPAELLKLEITESLLVADSPDMVPMFGRLKALGVQLSLDDFGTGYSSLSYLKRFPFDELKIDRSFVNDITTDPEDAALCEAIIAIAKTLGMEVVGEGAETIDQIEFLRRRGVDTIQGYYYSRPLRGEALEKLLASGGPLPRRRDEEEKRETAEPA